MPKAKAGRPFEIMSTQELPIIDKPKTLTELGITKNQSSQWHRMAGQQCILGGINGGIIYV